MELFAAVEKIKNLPIQAIYYYYYETELLKAKIGFADYQERAKKAEELVKNFALSLENKDIIDIDSLIREFDLKINQEKLVENKNTIVFALFTEPNIIQVNTELCILSRQIAEENRLDDIASQNLFDVLLCHEVFHYIYSIKLQFDFSPLTYLEYKSLFMKRHSNLISLEELSASLFVKYFLKISYNIEVFTLLFTYTKDKRKAKSFFDTLCECEEKSKVF